MSTIIDLQNISAGYDKRKVLKNFSLMVHSGQKVLVIGPNGSGKSTLLKTIVGEIKSEKGKIFLKNEEIHSLPTFQRTKRGIGYLCQTNNIFPSLTVEDNLMIALLNEECTFDSKKEELLGYFPFLSKFLKMNAGILSGGQRQALAIAMVLLKEKDIYLLDEPTAGLSPVAAKDVLKVIKKFSEEKKKTIMLVEHNIRLVTDWYDRIIVMREGFIIEDKSSKDELSKDFLERIYFEDEKSNHSN